MSETELLSAVPADPTAAQSLRHVMLVGGTLAQWQSLTEREWSDRAGELGSYLGSIGVPWLTIRPYESGNPAAEGVANDSPNDASSATSPVVSTYPSPGCTVIIDPSADGRRRFAEAMRALPIDDDVTEESVSAILYQPADCEPDLVVILGRSDQLPPSLVWEIAYAELYFADVPWLEATLEVLSTAVEGFADRRRRFGGLPGVVEADYSVAESDTPDVPG